VRYKDAERREPAIGFPRLHILRNGERYLDEGPVTMLAADRSPSAQGRLYTYTLRLPGGRDYQHCFEVETGDGTRSKTERFDGPVVEGVAVVVSAAPPPQAGPCIVRVNRSMSAIPWSSRNSCR